MDDSKCHGQSRGEQGEAMYPPTRSLSHNHITKADARRQEGVTLPPDRVAIILNNNVPSWKLKFLKILAVYFFSLSHTLSMCPSIQK